MSEESEVRLKNPGANAPARARARASAERRKIKDEIAEMRAKSKKTEMRDGRKFVVVSIPDKYGADGPIGGTRW